MNLLLLCACFFCFDIFAMAPLENAQRTLVRIELIKAELENLQQMEPEKPDESPATSTVASLRKTQKENLAAETALLEKLKKTHGLKDADLQAGLEDIRSQMTSKKKSNEDRAAKELKAREAEARFRASQRPQSKPRTGE